MVWEYCSLSRAVAAQESERRLRDLLSGKKPQGAADAAAVASPAGNKKSVAARGSQMQLFQARMLGASLAIAAIADAVCVCSQIRYDGPKPPNRVQSVVIIPTGPHLILPSRYCQNLTAITPALPWDACWTNFLSK